MTENLRHVTITMEQIVTKKLNSLSELLDRVFEESLLLASIDQGKLERDIKVLLDRRVDDFKLTLVKMKADKTFPSYMRSLKKEPTPPPKPLVEKNMHFIPTAPKYANLASNRKVRFSGKEKEEK